MLCYVLAVNVSGDRVLFVATLVEEVVLDNVAGGV
jgi:hypothetical protein